MTSKVRVLLPPPAFAREAREGCRAEAQRAQAGCRRELRLGKPSKIGKRRSEGRLEVAQGRSRAFAAIPTPHLRSVVAFMTVQRRP